jgi:Zn-finger nucleic acid-binding protein
LKVAVSDGRTGYVCDKCRGLWLPHRWIDALRHELSSFSWNDMRRELEQTAKPSKVHCASGCGQLSASLIGSVEVDWCISCEGVWFDREEVQNALAQWPAQRLADRGWPADILIGLINALPSI